MGTTTATLSVRSVGTDDRCTRPSRFMMVRFDGKLRLAGDPGGAVRAVFEIDNDRLMVTAGDQEIGNWHLRELTVTHRPEGVALAVEGDELIVAVSDRNGLAEALALPQARTVKKRPMRRRKRARSDESSLSDALPPPIGTPVESPETQSRKTPPRAQPVAEPPAPEPPRETFQPESPDKRSPALRDRLAATSLEFRAGVVLLVVVALMFIFARRLLALILGISGAAGLLVGAAAEDPYFGVRMPSWIRSRPTMIAGSILLALALVVFWAS